MSAPPVPPRPYSPQSNPPPPPPPTIRFSTPNPSQFESPPHFDNPLAAPRPHKLDPSLPANMARSLDDQLNYQNPYRGPSPGPPPPPPPLPPHPPAFPNYQSNPGYPQAPGGFSYPASPQAPPQQPQTQWSPWAPQPPTGVFPQSSTPMPYPGTPAPQSIQPSFQPTFQPPQPSFHPPPQHQQQPYQQPHRPSDTLSPAMANLSFNPHPQHSPPHQQRPPPTSYSPPHQQRPPPNSYHDTPPTSSPPKPTQAQPSIPSLTAPLPTIPQLTQALPAIQNPTHDPATKIAWCRDVLFLIDRLQQQSSPNAPSTEPTIGPAKITDPQLQRLAQVAVPLILQISNSNSQQTPLPPHIAEAIYMRATLAANGAFPEHIPPSPRTAFRDFETAARAGFANAWFRLGRDYENFADFGRAVECFEKGVKLGVESCCYRMGMAHLMSQLSLPPSFDLAIPLLHRAATLATIDVPQPAYVFGLLLLSDFTQISVPPHFFTPVIPQGSSVLGEARKHLERAAYLNFAPAQYKLGHAYEFAQPPFPFDALLSVQYYSLASQAGEVEADMALSKWFLCGSGEGAGGGGFEKDEGLAWTFAEKAARRGLASAEFAMGYYAEVGVGGGKDIEGARRWYSRASEHGNTDAVERLAALSKPTPQALSRQEHDTLTESKLVRTRTQAQLRSDAGGAGGGRRRVQGQGETKRIVENIRKTSTLMPPVQQQQGYQEGQGQGQIRTSPTIQGQGPGPGPVNPRPRIQSYQSGPGPVPAPANKHRMSVALIDPGASSGPGPSSEPPRRPGTAGGGRPATVGGGRGGAVGVGRRQSVGGEAGGGGAGIQVQVVPAKPTGKGPATFAEMGFQGAKAEDKECVVM